MSKRNDKGDERLMELIERWLELKEIEGDDLLIPIELEKEFETKKKLNKEQEEEMQAIACEIAALLNI